jgi:transcriptional regulator GlxA family with amidase domain
VKIAIVTFEGFNEIDSFVALNILNRVKQENWKAEIAAPTGVVTSLNGVSIHAQRPLDFVSEADAVLFGSGRLTRQIVRDEGLMAQLKVAPEKQLIGSQCSGALIMKKLGLAENIPLCTDATTRPFLLETGAAVLDQPFYTNGQIASAGGCLSAVYLATWVILSLAGRAAAEDALGYVAPVGEQEKFVENALKVVMGSPVTN